MPVFEDIKSEVGAVQYLYLLTQNYYFMWNTKSHSLISGLVLPSSQKLTLGLLALPRVCTVPSVSANFKMHSGICVLGGCSARHAILPRSPQLCQNGGLLVYLQSRGKEKLGGRGRQSVAFGQKYPVKKEI
jgi:hypothetical protein